ncbi:hypothetical protein F7725_011846 [Dissostichus mawsoni]|uniref:Integrase core domain-containing protein n=1 Tax=Dissostichus mawsoni TaxID=36200 RepID=A0A7J5ZA45_DISMA|nr:hypothetical protein F7725_011846 [Dissostichus mawsoni]
MPLCRCIDGFSRKVVWLECGPTNNNPRVITQYFLKCVRNLSVIPMRLRTDCGTENGIMAAIQCSLCHHHHDYYSGASSHMYGSSMTNQRNESWWSILRKGSSGWSYLQTSEMLDTSMGVMSISAFCFVDVIQKDLDECVRLWNSHRIRPSRTASCPGGVPNELHYLPHSLSIAPCGDQNMQEYLDFAMERNDLQKPENWETASELYMKLKEYAQL